MNLNSIIFPASTEDKTHELYRHKNSLIYIPKTFENGEIYHIPCLLLDSEKDPNTNKFLFYFHGNAEDIFNASINLDLLRVAVPVKYYIFNLV